MLVFLGLGLARTRLRLAQAKEAVHDPLLHIVRNVRDDRRPLKPEQIPYARGNLIVSVSSGLGYLVIVYSRYFDIFGDVLQAALKSPPPSLNSVHKFA